MVVAPADYPIRRTEYRCQETKLMHRWLKPQRRQLAPLPGCPLGRPDLAQAQVQEPQRVAPRISQSANTQFTHMQFVPERNRLKYAVVEFPPSQSVLTHLTTSIQLEQHRTLHW